MTPTCHMYIYATAHKLVTLDMVAAHYLSAETLVAINVWLML